MDSGPLILELSSDEDDCSFESKPNFFDGMAGKKVGKGGLVVRVVSGMKNIIGNKRNSGTLMQKNGNAGDESDDDCLVLDSDPELLTAIVVSNKVGGDEDDLLVVQEKGQVALRDYPHSRHLCVTFLFNASPHVQHCNLCHCYVCDCLAPCKFWGNGDLATDHCHSTDKDEKWKSLRLRFKRKIVSPHSVKRLDDAVSNMPPAQKRVPFSRSNQVPPRNTSVTRPCSATSNRNHRSYNQNNPQLPLIDASCNRKQAEYFARSNPPINGTTPSPSVAGLSGASVPQLIHPCFKQPRTMQNNSSSLTSSTHSACNNYPRPVHNQNYVTTNKSQMSPHLRQPASTYGNSVKALASKNIQESEPPAAKFSHQSQPGRPSVNQRQMWQASCASMAHGPRVVSNISRNTSAAEPTVNFPPAQSMGLPKGNFDQYTDFSVPPVSVNENNLFVASSNLADNIAKHGHGKESDPSVVPQHNIQPPLNNSSSEYSHLQSILADVEKMLGEPITDVSFAGSDPNSLFYDRVDPSILLRDPNAPWSSILQTRSNSNPSVG